jgi:flagella basal body P-ring formation protein FlgA
MRPTSSLGFFDRLIVGLLLFMSPSAYSASAAVEEWRALGHAFLERHVAGSKKNIVVYAPDAAVEMPACTNLEAFAPLGAKMQGLTLVGIRCLAPKGWTVHLKARVEILGTVLTSTQALPSGHLITEADILEQEGDLTLLPPNAVSDKKTLLGQVTVISLSPGQTWRRDQIRPTYVLESGQTVQVRVIGTGFQVTGEGVALTAATEGQRVQIRNPKGGLITGIAHAGAWVEVKL